MQGCKEQYPVTENLSFNATMGENDTRKHALNLKKWLVLTSMVILLLGMVGTLCYLVASRYHKLSPASVKQLFPKGVDAKSFTQHAGKIGENISHKSQAAGVSLLKARNHTAAKWFVIIVGSMFIAVLLTPACGCAG